MYQFFMELMKVPRIEAKLRVFAFKITFASQVEISKSLNLVAPVFRHVVIDVVFFGSFQAEELKSCLNIVNAAVKEV